MNQISISFTAHRGNNPSMGGYDLYSKKNKLILESLINTLENLTSKYDKIYFFVGGALTGDQLSFKACEYIRDKYINKIVKIFLCIPFVGFGLWWLDGIDELNREKQVATKVFYIDRIKQYSNPKYKNKYHISKYTNRNKFMIDMSDIVIALYDGSSKKGGTYNSIQYAKQVNKQLIIINVSKIREDD